MPPARVKKKQVDEKNSNIKKQSFTVKDMKQKLKFYREGKNQRKKADKSTSFSDHHTVMGSNNPSTSSAIKKTPSNYETSRSNQEIDCICSSLNVTSDDNKLHNGTSRNKISNYSILDGSTSINDYKCIRQIKLEHERDKESNFKCIREHEYEKQKEYHKQHPNRVHQYSNSLFGGPCTIAGPFENPLIRGMLSYAILWPLGSILQEYLENGTSLYNINWARAARFSFFGAIFMAPTLHVWIKLASRYIKKDDIKSALIVSLVEQITYTPLAFVYFFFGMSLLEMKTVNEAINEVKIKFWPTFKASFIYWPTVQTLNFYLVPQSMRIVVVCLASFLWMTFMAHMKAWKMQQNGRQTGWCGRRRNKQRKPAKRCHTHPRRKPSRRRTEYVGYAYCPRSRNRYSGRATFTCRY